MWTPWIDPSLGAVGDSVNPDIGIDHFLADTDVGIDHFLADTDNHSYTNGTNGICTHIRSTTQREDPMERTAMNDLVRWKDRPARKPLVVTGVRQVGKTWLVKEFGARCFENVAHVVFLDNDEMQGAFERSLDPDRLLDAIGIATGTNPHDGNTLVFLDEIQECPRAITSLKLFCEKRPDVPIVAAGSLLGVAMARQDANREKTATRSSHLMAGRKSRIPGHASHDIRRVSRRPRERRLASAVAKGDFALTETFSERLGELLKSYLYVGGMPEAVQAYADQPGDLAHVRTIQRRLLRDYEYRLRQACRPPIQYRTDTPDLALRTRPRSLQKAT